MEIIRDSYENVTYRYVLDVDKHYLDASNEYLQKRLVEPDPLAVIDEDTIKHVINGDYEEDFTIKVKGWREGTSYDVSFYEWIEDMINEDLWECDSELLDGESYGSDTWIEE